MQTCSFGGFDYFSVPELKVVDPTGSGSGAEIRATISEGKVNSVTVVNRYWIFWYY